MPNETYRLSRELDPRELDDTQYPIPPLNLTVTLADRGAIDLRWDNPGQIQANNQYQIQGVNLYRSYDSEYSGYVKINSTPLGALYYRDANENITVTDENVSNKFLAKGENHPEGIWVLRPTNYPIVKAGSQGVPASHPSDVTLKIDGKVVPVQHVAGTTGEVYLNTAKLWNEKTRKLINPVLPATNSVVLLTYTYNKTLITSQLVQRIFYKATTVATRASLTVETPLEKVHAHNAYQIEHLDYIWAEAIRRNRWILEQGGEPVKVFLRKWVGPKCSCYSDHHKRSEGDCLTCFPPGTLIRTEHGYMPIESVNVGDKILTSDGTFRRVIRTLERHYDGVLKAIKSNVTPTHILSTTEHPFLSLGGAHKVKGGCRPSTCDNRLENKHGYCIGKRSSGRWSARCQVNGNRGSKRWTIGTFDTREEAILRIEEFRNRLENKRHLLVWKEAGAIKEKDWLVAKWPTADVDLEFVDIPPMYQKQSNFGPSPIGNTRFKLTDDFLWMVGLYIAEGSSGDREITFSLHSDETEFHDRLVKFFAEQGYHPKTRPSKNSRGTVIAVASAHLARWFPDWLGPYCDQKRIPEELMLLPAHKAQALLQGIYDGDGTKGYFEIGQTSVILALQIAEICHRLGKEPLIRAWQARSLTPNGNVRKQAYMVSWGTDGFWHQNRKGRWAFGGDVLSRVTEVVDVPYAGPVHNLEVEVNPTYVVNGVIVHNCYSTGITGGFEGPFDILIGPQDGERQVELTENGMHVIHQYEVWTGPSPLLGQRDFLVRQNNDRYSIGPVNTPSNRGTVLQQMFSIGYLDEKDIRYAVPAVPSSTLTYPQTRIIDWEEPGKAGTVYPQITDNPQEPDGEQPRGRTPAYGRISRAR